MKTIVVATNNQHKLQEYKEILKPLGFKILSLKDLDIIDDVEETGTTYAENSQIKARSFATRKRKVPFLADDSGIEIAALDNQPGIYTHRFLSGFSSRKNAFEYIIKKTKETGKNEAIFYCSITYIQEGFSEVTVQGFVKGKIVDELPKDIEGFGYDPIFIPENQSETFNNLHFSIKNKISHRAEAVNKLLKLLPLEQ